MKDLVRIRRIKPEPDGLNSTDFFNIQNFKMEQHLPRETLMIYY